MVRNHQGNKQPIEPSLVNQTTSKADYTTDAKFLQHFHTGFYWHYFRSKVDFFSVFHFFRYAFVINVESTKM